MNAHGYPGIRTDVHSHPWISIHRCAWISMVSSTYTYTLIQGHLFEMRNLSAAEFAIGGPLYYGTSAQNWYKTMCQGRNALSAGSTLRSVAGAE